MHVYMHVYISLASARDLMTQRDVTQNGVERPGDLETGNSDGCYFVGTPCILVPKCIPLQPLLGKKDAQNLSSNTHNVSIAVDAVSSSLLPYKHAVITKKTEYEINAEPVT